MSLFELSAWQKLTLSGNVLFQQFVAIFITTVVWIISNERDWASVGTWHIFLCTIGFALFMAEALVLFNESNIFSLGLKKVFKGYLHGMLMLLACLCVTIGVSLKIQQKVDAGATHFTSIHGKLGLTSWILTLVAVGGGIVLQFSRKLRFIPPVFLKLIHLSIGVAAYVIGCVALGYGLNNYMGLATVTIRALQSILGLYVGYTLLSPAMSLFSYLKSIFSSD